MTAIHTARIHSKKTPSKLRWIRWTIRQGGALVTSRAHAFLVKAGRMGRRSLCGRKWKEKGIQVVAHPELERCPRCDEALRCGEVEGLDEAAFDRAMKRAEASSEATPPTEYRPRFTLRDFE